MKQFRNKFIAGLGPGTKAMLIGIAAFGAYSFVTKPDGPKSRYYEADRMGKLVEVERPSTGTSAPPPLWKPEPELLLDAGPLIKLDGGQVREIEKISAAWKLEKAELESRLRSASETVARSSERFSVVERRSEIEDYSLLSRLYDERRQAFWQESVSKLDPAQRGAVSRLREGRP